MSGRRRRRGPPQGGASAIRLRAGSDTPIRLLRDIAEKRVDPTDLTKKQRHACLAVMANGKQTSAELAQIFLVSPGLIRRDLQEIRATLGREYREWGIDEVVGDLVASSERCYTTAMAQEDVALAWSIKRDTIKLLRELGVGEARDGRDRMRITIETIGQGYDRARGQLAAALDPVLTGLVIESERAPSPLEALGISAPRTLPGPTIDVEPSEVVVVEGQAHGSDLLGAP